MKRTNEDIARSLIEFSELLEASGDNPYRVRAYRRAAQSIAKLDKEVHVLINEGFDLTSLPWVGEKIASAITALITKNEALVLRESPKGKTLNELKDIRGLSGPKIKLLNEQFNIFTKHDLIQALEKNQLAAKDGLSPKLLERLKLELKTPRASTKFLRLYHAINVVDSLLKHLQELPEVEWVHCAGEFRRKKDVISCLDFIVCTPNFPALIKKFSHFPSIKDIVNQSQHSISVHLRVGIKMNLYCAAADSLGASLLFHTGSHAHINHIFEWAEKKAFALTDSGLFYQGKRIAGNQEKEIYQSLGLIYIEPELREDRGEIEASAAAKMPHLIELQDIKGDLHSHTNETDGREPLEVMVQAAIAKGYEYLAITDHSKRLAITHGLDEKRLMQQIEQINQLNSQLTNFLILKSIEEDILEDGSLDLSNEVLKELDIVVCSIHSKFHLPEEKQTIRILKAMDNPYFNILGHATGRLIKSRPPYPISLEKILHAAKERGCFVELNAQPYRMDIHDEYCQMAKKIGVKVAISSDAHSIRDFNYMPLGIYQARRGWLEKKDVLNTFSWPKLKKLIKRN